MATDLGTAVVTEVVTSLGTKIVKHIAYIFRYNKSLKILEDAKRNLDNKRQDAKRFTDDANRKLNDVSKGVLDWQTKADELAKEAEELISGYNISCLNLCSRYSSSKHASELADEISKKVQNEPHFGNVFDRQPLTLGAKFERTGELEGFREFQSRVSVMNQVWDALKDEKVRMLSICGMGGTGKTTLVKKLIQKLERDPLFDMVSIATVSQNPNPRNIRADIVSNLEWKFEKEELDTPNKLLNSLSNNDKRILLILDDVWDKVDFAEIGLPKSSLKIMLTSREQSVCQNMGSKHNFVIKVLTKKEARRLFNGIAKETIDKLNLHKKAEEIADQCGGLPLVIVPLATALKDEIEATWNTSLLKLQNSNGPNISELDKVYSRIGLSYDLLNDPEAKSCFLLCSLFPEDFNVPVELLVFFGKGLQLFDGMKTMSETRERVESIINKLKKSFLLLDGEKYGTVKMHDILRDFAIHISSKVYIVRCEKVMNKWPERSKYENRIRISFMCDEIKDYPTYLKCPNLELLQLRVGDGSKELPFGIFEELKELKVLVLDISSLVPSLTALKELRTLIINVNVEDMKIGDLLGHGDMTNLEILVFEFKLRIGDFPEEIGKMCNLRCLKLWRVEFEYMPPGLLSKLGQLEELELSYNFCGWGCMEEGGKRMNASLDDIKYLPLTTLQINVGTCSILSKELVQSLKRFDVYFKDACSSLYYEDASLSLYDVDACDDRVSCISGLLSKCQSLHLRKVRNLKNSMCLQTVRWSRFTNLRDIRIEFCPKLTRLFPLSVAIEMRQVQKIFIRYCDEMEKLFYNNQVDGEHEQVVLESTTIVTPISLDDKPRGSCCPKEKHPKMVSTPEIMNENIAKVDEIDVDREIIIFPQLKELHLKYLPKLKSVYDGNHAIKLPLLEHLSIIGMNMEGLSYGSFNAPKLEQININYKDYPAGEYLNATVKTKIGSFLWLI